MRIPTEIHRFFEIGEGQTLLIKGLPGTGKTTLAFEILNVMCEKRNGMYISTRVDPDRLYRTFPWIKEIVPPRNVVNATQSKLLQTLRNIAGGIPTYDTVLDFFRVLFEDVEDMESPIIVFDSWDALMNYISPIIKEQQSFEQNICEFARDMGIHIIFVSESADLMPLDYIVDGVVYMEHYRIAGTPSSAVRDSGMRTRYAREIRLEKLRGVEILQRTFTATLHGGRFQCFTPCVEDGDARIGGDHVRISDPKEDCASTGIPQLDEITGGLKYGSCNVLEINHGVGKRYYHILTALASNALKNGRAVCIIPSIGYQLSPREIFVPTNVRVVQPYGDDIVSWGKELIGIWDELRERSGRPILNIIGMDAMEFAFGYRQLLNIANRLINQWKETNDINLLVVKTGQESINMAIHVADTYFVVNELNGGLCIYGVIPRTELYNMSFEGGSRICLTPIV
ncbi:MULTISPECIES: gas vesicle protein GvpD P-loop domain-containing protein [Methanothrix]|uniref:GvpD gas vesicle n=1 Tax=Methanothrix thermoacetophila (strain DSM 6194 / JCM 14653 / NBRC 101360 / PT) TaxID=349307 RepID=A0B6C4_METTP|nr:MULTISPECIES: gas vesicle protein GvpD P-loop domain-containing protein [Methanothrix]ABK14248.1 GvpD gas vesicle [Methanothrix thermoacetophila PT]NPU87726.1 GvpD gas vesicle [Methanothrix sp.]